jgi:hypothetical protein
MVHKYIDILALLLADIKSEIKDLLPTACVLVLVCVWDEKVFKASILLLSPLLARSRRQVEGFI